MPFLSVSLVIAGLASLGLPGTSGFVSEITIFLGSFSAWKIPTLIATAGVVLTAGYILWMIQRTILGPLPDKYHRLNDASLPEMIPIAILTLTIIAVGIYPAFISDAFGEGISPIIQSIRLAN